jgi:hypothetical protein
MLSSKNSIFPNFPISRNLDATFLEIPKKSKLSDTQEKERV